MIPRRRPPRDHTSTSRRCRRASGYRRRIGSTSDARNASTCSGDRPTNREGSRTSDRSTFAKAGSAFRRSIRSLPPRPSLSRGRGRERAGSDALVQILAIASRSDGGHQDVLGRHERQLVLDVPRDHRRVDDQAGHDVQVQIQDRVDGQEGLAAGRCDGRRCRRASARAIGSRRSARPSRGIPSRRGRSSRFARRASDSACRPSPTIRSGRPRTAPPPRARGPAGASRDAEPMPALGHPGQRRDDLRVELPRVRLTRDGRDRLEPEGVGHSPIQFVDLRVIAVEQGEEARLRPGRPLDAEEGQVVQPTLDVAQVEDQLIRPQGRPLADRDELSGLEMGVSQARQVLPSDRERRRGRRSRRRGRRGRGPDPSRRRIRSVLSVTKQLVAPRWMIGLASGATSPRAWTWAITSWRSRFSWAFAASKSISSTFARRSAIWASEMSSPRARSASASATQSRRQVENLRRGDQRAIIAWPAYRVVSGLT